MEIKTSRNGSPTLVHNNKALHSLYNPEKEAERFIENNPELKLKSSEFPVVLIGAGLGYLLRVLKKRFPKTPLIALFYNEELARYSIKYNRVPDVEIWYPEMGIPLNVFLHKYIREENLPYSTFIEWKASGNLFPGTSQEVRNSISSTIRTNQKNIIVTGSFGQRWIKNCCRNLSRYSYDYTLKKGTTPVLVTSSGPSLKSSLKQIKHNRSILYILSLSSSVETLVSHDIIPDAVVSTDPGYYARLHYRSTPPKCPLFIPASAASDQSITTNKPVFLSQSTLLENSLNKRVPFFMTSESGTVTLTALNIAAALSSGPVYLAGQDFCFSDIKSHALPHSFHSLFLTTSNRKEPLTGTFFKRAALQAPEKGKTIRTGEALNAYAQWLITNPPEYYDRIYRIAPSPITIPWMGEIQWKDIKNGNSGTEKPRYDKRELPWNRIMLSEELEALAESVKTGGPEGMRILYNLDTSRILKYKKALQEKNKELADSLKNESAGYVYNFIGELISRYD